MEACRVYVGHIRSHNTNFKHGLGWAVKLEIQQVNILHISNKSNFFFFSSCLNTSHHRSYIIWPVFLSYWPLKALGTGWREVNTGCDSKPDSEYKKCLCIWHKTSISTPLENHRGFMRQERRQREKDSEVSSVHLTWHLSWAKTSQCPDVTWWDCFRVTTFLFTSPPGLRNAIVGTVVDYGVKKKDHRTDMKAMRATRPDEVKRSSYIILLEVDRLWHHSRLLGSEPSVTVLYMTAVGGEAEINILLLSQPYFLQLIPGDPRGGRPVLKIEEDKCFEMQRF